MFEPIHDDGQFARENAEARRQLPPPVRPIWRFVIAAVFLFAANYVAGWIAFMIFGSHLLVADAAYRGIALAFALIGFCFMLRVFDDKVGDLWGAMGLPLETTAFREIGKGLLIGAGMIAVAVAAIAALGKLTIRARLDVAASERLLIVTVLLLFGAMLEEVMFRGYPFQRLVDSVGPVGAVLALSAIFGAVHLSNPDNHGLWSWEFFNTVAVGALFAVAYLRTKSLWMPFGMHFGWNFTLGVLLGLPVSGMKVFGVVVHSTAAGSRLLTGGGYGIEGSLTGAAVILLGFVPVLYFTRGHLTRKADDFSGSGI